MLLRCPSPTSRALQQPKETAQAVLLPRRPRLLSPLLRNYRPAQRRKPLVCGWSEAAEKMSGDPTWLCAALDVCRCLAPLALCTMHVTEKAAVDCLWGLSMELT